MLKYYESSGRFDSFSANHTLPYSIICLQEMNLAYHYGKIFWNTAVLSVNAAADEGSDSDKTTTNYGKIAKAIGSIQMQGQQIELPDINKAHFGFYPDTEKDCIVFGLKGIVGVNDDIANFIINNRPYSSFDDFYKKVQLFKQSQKDQKENIDEESFGEDGETQTTLKLGDSVVINLIKAGCFDNIEKCSRRELFRRFVSSLSNPLKSLSIGAIKTLDEYGFLTEEERNFELRIVKFKDYVYSKQFFYMQTGKSANTSFFKLEHRFAEPYFLKIFEERMEQEKDYVYTDDGFIAVKRGSLDREIKKILEPFENSVLKLPQTLEKVNELRANEKWFPYSEETISKWEMDSISFYYHEHELNDIDEESYGIANFFELPMQGQIVDYYNYRGSMKPRFKLQKIAGTVLDKDKNKHIVTLLTKYGVVNVKFYKGQFAFYDKQISLINEDGTKTVQDKSWFARGNKLLITGFRREDQFVPKKYSDSAFQHCLQLIEKVNGKDLVLRTEREKQNDEEV